MDGVFGGLEARVAPWVSVLGEYDGKETSAGIRLNIPKEWSEDIRLNATVASNLSDDNHFSFMINAVIPLQRKIKYLPGFSSSNDVQAENSIKQSSTTPLDSDESIQKLVEALTEDGLQNISISTQDDIIFIAYENTVYIYNELDAIGSVLRKASALSSSYKKFVLQPKKSNVVITSISGSLEKANMFYLKPSFESKTAFVATLSESKDRTMQGQIRISDANSGRFKTHVVVSPKLTTFLGTELGAFDYQLLMGFTAYWNLYTGLDFSTRYNADIANSDNLDPVSGLLGGSYDEGGVNSAMLHYTMNMYGALNMLSAGLCEYDYVGAMDQLIYNYNRHTVKLKVGYFEHKDYSNLTKEIYLAKYTYNYTPMNLFLEVQAGKYWYQDTGFGLTVKRFFGDVAVSVNYLQTSPEIQSIYSEDTNKYIGLAIEFPLDFRKSKTSGKYFQLQGDNSWRYAQRTTVARKDGRNAIVPFSGYDPIVDLESEKYLMNQNRMNIDYIKSNAERLLDTF